MTKNTTETVYLVKFDRGYYAAKQPNYQWSFTDDMLSALTYKTFKKAQERGKHGTYFNSQVQSYTIERYTVKKTFEFEGIEE